MCSPDQVHTQQSLSGDDGLSGPDRLVPDTDSLVIGSHFCAPHPSRFAEDNSMSLLHLRDLDVCALQVQMSQRDGGRMIVVLYTQSDIGVNRWLQCKVYCVQWARQSMRDKIRCILTHIWPKILYISVSISYIQ